MNPDLDGYWEDKFEDPVVHVANVGEDYQKTEYAVEALLPDFLFSHWEQVDRGVWYADDPEGGGFGVFYDEEDGRLDVVGEDSDEVEIFAERLKPISDLSAEEVRENMHASQAIQDLLENLEEFADQEE